MTDSTPPPPPTRRALFLGFTKVGLLSVGGGAAAWARRLIVEERGWLPEREFAEILALGQVLPGPNVGNTAVMLGRRFHGVSGALAAAGGFYAVPLLGLVAMLLAYDRLSDEPALAPFFHGIAAAAAGLVIGTALRMATKLRPPPEAILLGLAATAAAAWARWPLPLIVLALAPVAIAAARWRDARSARTTP